MSRWLESEGRLEYELLFLNEMFIDSVYISTSSLDMDASTKSKLRETCLMFKIGNNEPLMLCEEEVSYQTPPQRSASDDVQLTFKCGKSCMNSLSESFVKTLKDYYEMGVVVDVVRKIEDNGEISEIVIGSTFMKIPNSFADILHAGLNELDLPVARTNQGIFDVLDKKDRKIGAITGFLRRTLLGPMVVTNFQAGANDAFMFKGTGTDDMVGLPWDESKIPKIEVDPNAAAPQSSPPQLLPKPATGQLSPYGDWVDRRTAKYPAGYYPPVVTRAPPPPPPEEPGNYKEIVAEIRGHSLHIRVPMRSKKDKEVCKKQLTEGMQGPVCRFAPQLNLCDCDYPVPPEAVPRCPLPPQC